MNNRKLFSSICFLFVSLLSVYEGVNGLGQHQSDDLFGFKPTKMFVFGDSNADTGNYPKTIANSYSWRFPYGISFPGKPTGRFSDGRVATDFFSKYLGILPPIAYKWRKYALQHLKKGMNFAYAGSGVFNTIFNMPSVTLQIDYFQRMIHEGLYSAADLRSSSVALVSLATNDYTTYAVRNGTNLGSKPFIISVVDHLIAAVKRIHELGVRKIAVATLPPLGCIAQVTAAFGFQCCNETKNANLNFHNVLLHQAVAKLNDETRDSTFIILDFYNAFSTVIKNKGVPGVSKFLDPLRPCCMRIGKGDFCGSVDTNGTKKYTICTDPKSAFYWDLLHPTQEAWRSIFSFLFPNFKRF